MDNHGRIDSGDFYMQSRVLFPSALPPAPPPAAPAGPVHIFYLLLLTTFTDITNLFSATSPLHQLLHALTPASWVPAAIWLFALSTNITLLLWLDLWPFKTASYLRLRSWPCRRFSQLRWLWTPARRRRSRSRAVKMPGTWPVAPAEPPRLSGFAPIFPGGEAEFERLLRMQRDGARPLAGAGGDSEDEFEKAHTAVVMHREDVRHYVRFGVGVATPVPTKLAGVQKKNAVQNKTASQNKTTGQKKTGVQKKKTSGTKVAGGAGGASKDGKLGC
ncbi:hypothetical protein EDC01DRAFT_636957 [Geopyxis carbonaria]|nr:hypothetical protein EDC01DRAFT_636957 [Geopyxis carbonaria]